jgi:hypothetical protein
LICALDGANFNCLDLLPFFVGTLAGKSSPAARPTRTHGGKQITIGDLQ